MNRLLISVVAAAAAAILWAAGCAQAPPPATPTAVLVPPTRVVEPTNAVELTRPPTAQPTPVPTKAVDYPAKGKTITLIVPWAAGGAADIQARILATALERDLGVPVVVVPKPGAGTQVGITELVRSKPDGYTFAMVTFASTPFTYLDPERKASYGRKDLLPVANQVWDPVALAVVTESPYKSLRDLVDAAKTKPGQIKVGDDGIQSSSRIGMLVFERLAGVKFGAVHFEGAPPSLNALLGGHVDASALMVANLPPHVKSGKVRVLGVMDRERYKFLPEAETFEEQGYKIVSGASRGYVLPAGTPKEIVDILSQAIKRAIESEELKKKMDEVTQVQRYMGPAEYAAYWDEFDAEVKLLLPELTAEQK